MRKICNILLAFALLSCSQNNLDPQHEIFNEWSWVETDYATQTPYKTAAALDSTFYYNFQENGTIEIKDNERKTVSSGQFKLTPPNQITIDNMLYSYTIDNEKLTIKNIDGIIVWITVFKIVK